MSKRVVKNYGFYGRFNHYLPKVSGMFGLLLFLLAGAVIGGIFALLVPAIYQGSSGNEVSTMVSYVVMFIPAMLYASSRSRINMMNKGGLKLDNGHFAPVGGPLSAVLVVIATLCAAYCCEPITALLPEMPEVLKAALDSMVQGNFFLNFLCVSIFAPFFEEWLCRGMVLRGLLGNGMKPIWAIVISAVFFAVIHANPWQAIPAFTLGVLFGYIYYKTGSLKLTMLMHFANNTFSLIMSNVPAFQEAETFRDVLQGPLYWIIFAAAALMLVLIVKKFATIKVEDNTSAFEKVPSLFDDTQV
ncbi:MAG: CPBP family intramembrane metalloprotease [Bacteroidales bacterium]|nr:CPBP family intramembrane metalloprotease [Bacteroidales bacterium]